MTVASSRFTFTGTPTCSWPPSIRKFTGAGREERIVGWRGFCRRRRLTGSALGFLDRRGDGGVEFVFGQVDGLAIEKCLAFAQPGIAFVGILGALEKIHVPRHRRFRQFAHGRDRFEDQMRRGQDYTEHQAQPRTDQNLGPTGLVKCVLRYCSWGKGAGRLIRLLGGRRFLLTIGVGRRGLSSALGFRALFRAFFGRGGFHARGFPIIGGVKAGAFEDQAAAAADFPPAAGLSCRRCRP